MRLNKTTGNVDEALILLLFFPEPTVLLTVAFTVF